MRTHMLQRLAGLIAVTGGAGLVLAQDHGPVAHGEELTPFWTHAAFGRADVVGISDTNQLYNGGGWDEGWARALHERLGLYATGVHSSGEAGLPGARVGWNSDAIVPVSPYAYSGAPAELDNYLSAAGVSPLRYIFLPQDESAAGDVGAGLVLAQDSVLDVNSALRFHFTIGKFAGLGPGSFLPVIRREAAPFSLLAGDTVFVTRTGSDVIPSGVFSGFVDLPAGVRNAPVALRFAMPGGHPVAGPFLGYYTRVENTTRPRGAAFHTLLAGEGYSARDMASALQGVSDATLSLFFERVRSLQTGPRSVLVRINAGIYDRTETLPSVGAAQVAQGNSDLAYEDNVQAIIDRIREIWTLNGWTETELSFLLTVSHPILLPDDELLRQYRARASALCHENERTASVKFDLLITAQQMSLNGWYADADRLTLTPEGYRAMALMEVMNLIQDGSCTADFDGDGDIGTDADIEAFFAALGGIGPGNVDLNGDGDVGTDADIEAFFRVLTGGTC